MRGGAALGIDTLENLALQYALAAMNMRPSNYAVGIAVDDREVCIAIMDGEHQLSASHGPKVFTLMRINTEIMHLLRRFAVDPEEYTAPEYFLQKA